MFEPIAFENHKIFAGTTQPRNIGAGFIYGSDLKAGSVVASRGVATSASKAKKSVTFTGTPVASKTVKVAVNGKEVTYTTASTTLATEVAGIKAAINGDSALGAIVEADNASGKLTIEWKENGVDFYSGGCDRCISRSQQGSPAGNPDQICRTYDCRETLGAYDYGDLDHHLQG